MAKVMFQFRHTGAPPTLEQVCATYNVRLDEIDAEYGCILSDSQAGLYVAMVEESARGRIDAALQRLGLSGDPAVGLFSDPRIEPMGLT